MPVWLSHTARLCLDNPPPFFSGMVSSADSSLLVYYAEDRLGFTEKDVSMILFISGIGGLLVQGILLKPLNECVGEKMVVALCFFLGAVYNVMYGLAQDKATIYVAVTISALSGMAFPTISAIKANNVVSRYCCVVAETLLCRNPQSQPVRLF
jgi:Na+/melibiose symporter-like transporter